MAKKLKKNGISSKVLLRKMNGVLVPDSECEEEALYGINDGDTVICDIHKPRNPYFHRLYFAMLRLVFDNQSLYTNIDQLLDVIKLKIGHYELYKVNGKEFTKTKSISFSEMSEHEFQKIYHATLDFICEEIIPGMEVEDLKSEVFALLRFT